jgi:ATP-dependent Clp protease ATP-binding subunit ClpA
MNKVLIFYGSQQEYEKHIPTGNFRNLTDLVMEIDSDTRMIYLVNPDKAEPQKEKVVVENFVIGSSEYAGVREHVILNFANFLSKIDVRNLYLHNPPIQISSQIQKLYPQTIIEKQSYNTFRYEDISMFCIEFDTKIKGQEAVKYQILKSLFPLTTEKREKPVVLLFYGDTGLGKTETAKLLSDILGEKLFRKQFSMFQNNQFATYLFGGSHFEKSFAKDLLDRESNVILLDEFDKANATFHSAFYQMFDDSVFEDQNYRLELKKSIIICTSNYKSIDEIKKQLGNAIFSRFDAAIQFQPLSQSAKREIAKIQFDAKLKLLNEKQKETICNSNVEIPLIDMSVKCSNAREISQLIEQTIALKLIKYMIEI